MQNNHSLILTTGLTLVFFLFLSSCNSSSPNNPGKKSNTQNGVATTINNGIPHIHNGENPLSGTLQLHLTELYSIDSNLITLPNPPFFSNVLSTPDNHYFISDFNNHTVYRFEAATSKIVFEGSFLRQGEGPSEILFGVFTMGMAGEKLWIAAPRKIMWFTPTGSFIDEQRFEKSYRNVEVLDGERFIGCLTGRGNR